MRAGIGTLLLVGLAAAGCSKGLKLQPTRLSFDQFVNATVELRRAAAEASSPADFQLRKREIERQRHFSDDDLREFARVYASDVRVLSAAWDSVQERLDRPAVPAKAAPPGSAGGQKPRAAEEVVPGALPGGLPAVNQRDSMRPPPDDTLAPSPRLRNPPKAAANEHKPFY